MHLRNASIVYKTKTTFHKTYQSLIPSTQYTPFLQEKLKVVNIDIEEEEVHPLFRREDSDESIVRNVIRSLLNFRTFS